MINIQTNLTHRVLDACTMTLEVSQKVRQYMFVSHDGLECETLVHINDINDKLIGGFCSINGEIEYHDEWLKRTNKKALN